LKIILVETHESLFTVAKITLAEIENTTTLAGIEIYTYACRN
jgi:hypothetical protein